MKNGVGTAPILSRWVMFVDGFYEGVSARPPSLFMSFFVRSPRSFYDFYGFYAFFNTRVFATFLGFYEISEFSEKLENW